MSKPSSRNGRSSGGHPKARRTGPVALRPRGEIKELLVVEPTRVTRPFFSQLNFACEARVYEHFGDDWRFIRRCVPRAEFDNGDIVKNVHREFRQSLSIALLVIAPTSSHELTKTVAKLMTEHKVQVIALSLPFHGRHIFKSFGLAVPPSVVCDSATGVFELGRAAAAELVRTKNTSPVIVLIPGDRHRLDSRFRLRYFKRGLEELTLSPSYIEAAPCAWNRSLARNEMQKLIGELKRIDLVFAANDEMALGARDAIQRAAHSGEGSANQCVVYGFDAIDEVKLLIEANDPILRGTIQQNLSEMSDALVSLVTISERRPLEFSDTRLIKPTCILPRRVVARSQLVDLWPNIPLLPEGLLDSEEWLVEESAAKRECVTVGSLESYRKPCRGAIRPDSDPFLLRDKYGRICRKDSTSQRWYYFVASLRTA